MYVEVQQSLKNMHQVEVECVLLIMMHAYNKHSLYDKEVLTWEVTYTCKEVLTSISNFPGTCMMCTLLHILYL